MKLLAVLLLGLVAAASAQDTFQVNCLTDGAAQGLLGREFSEAVSASNPPSNTNSFLWEVHSGDLPTGLSLAPSSGVISGTPTVAGIFNFELEVGAFDNAETPALLGTATAACSIHIHSCEGGCTYSKGYWKNHEETFSEPAPSFRLGTQPAELEPANHHILVDSVAVADSLLSGKYCVLNPAIPGDYSGPKINQNGNPLNQLYAQLTALQLNLWKESSCTGNTEIDSAIAAANTLINNFDCFTIRGNQEAADEARELAGYFDSFNTGVIGPGHCDTLIPEPTLNP